MKSQITVIFFWAMLSFSCQQENGKVEKNNTANSATNSISDTIAPTGKDSLNSTKSLQTLALTGNALMLVDQQTGSTHEIQFGMPLDQLVTLVNRVLPLPVSSIVINSECGAGPLKMASWSNGLTLVFQEKKSTETWLFAGWFMRKVTDPHPLLITMAGIGIGSTRAEMESAYVIKVDKTSLGYEFSTTAGLFGIFSGKTDQDRITDMWSGASCNFR